MKVVHIESGLGNQMLSYGEYLVLKKIHPDEKIYIENIIYDIPECNDVICQWNGYELQRIFGINAPNIKEKFNETSWLQVLDEIVGSKFWEKNWNYPVYFSEAFKHAGLELMNIKGDFEESSFAKRYSENKTLRSRITDTCFGNWFRRQYHRLFKERWLSQFDRRKEVFYSGSEDIFTGQWLTLKYVNGDIEKIDKEIRAAFQFPKFTDDKNIKFAQYVVSVDSIAIHARRGDMLGYNGYCYKYGYFKRAIKFIRKNVKNPVFVFFCDPGSVDWCRKNERTFGLDFSRDVIHFVDWNSGENSFRDMQLMSMCKHQVVTNSSFGWWGAYLNSNPNKITCSPQIEINTTHHF